MDEHDEAELIRLEDDDWTERQDRRDVPFQGGAASVVGTTKTVATYPTTASRFFAMQLTTVFGQEVEGGNGSLTTVGKTFYALNLGTAIPSSGTVVICTYLSNRWVFRHDG